MPIVPLVRAAVRVIAYCLANAQPSRLSCPTSPVLGFTLQIYSPNKNDLFSFNLIPVKLPVTM